jgi:hypothetical protein
MSTYLSYLTQVESGTVDLGSEAQCLKPSLGKKLSPTPRQNDFDEKDLLNVILSQTATNYILHGGDKRIAIEAMVEDIVVQDVIHWIKSFHYLYNITTSYPGSTAGVDIYTQTIPSIGFRLPRDRWISMTSLEATLSVFALSQLCYDTCFFTSLQHFQALMYIIIKTETYTVADLICLSLQDDFAWFPTHIPQTPSTTATTTSITAIPTQPPGPLYLLQFALGKTVQYILTVTHNSPYLLSLLFPLLTIPNPTQPTARYISTFDVITHRNLSPNSEFRLPQQPLLQPLPSPFSSIWSQSTTTPSKDVENHIIEWIGDKNIQRGEFAPYYYESLPPKNKSTLFLNPFLETSLYHSYDSSDPKTKTLVDGQYGKNGKSNWRFLPPRYVERRRVNGIYATIANNATGSNTRDGLALYHMYYSCRLDPVSQRSKVLEFCLQLLCCHHPDIISQYDQIGYLTDAGFDWNADDYDELQRELYPNHSSSSTPTSSSTTTINNPISCTPHNLQTSQKTRTYGAVNRFQSPYSTKVPLFLPLLIRSLLYTTTTPYAPFHATPLSTLDLPPAMDPTWILAFLQRVLTPVWLRGLNFFYLDFVHKTFTITIAPFQHIDIVNSGQDMVVERMVDYYKQMATIPWNTIDGPTIAPLINTRINCSKKYRVDPDWSVPYTFSKFNIFIDVLENTLVGPQLVMVSLLWSQLYAIYSSYQTAEQPIEIAHWLCHDINDDGDRNGNGKKDGGWSNKIKSTRIDNDNILTSRRYIQTALQLAVVLGLDVETMAKHPIMESIIGNDWGNVIWDVDKIEPLLGTENGQIITKWDISCPQFTCNSPQHILDLVQM